MDRDLLLKKIKQTVREVEPNADIILYGSRSRGDASEESDWDFLILVEGSVTIARTDCIRHRLYEIEWESGEVISSIVRNRNEWKSGIFKAMPFYHRVSKEGVRVLLIGIKSWSITDTRMKTVFYPGVSREHQFEKGYIAVKLSHSRGSTVDLTIVPENASPLADGLDMGSGFDLFSKKSWPDSMAVSRKPWQKGCFCKP
jgi:predicted nucleotidyltransferase